MRLSHSDSQAVHDKKLAQSLSVVEYFASPSEDTASDTLSKLKKAIKLYKLS